MADSSQEKRVWALATLAELELLGSVCDKNFDGEDAERVIKNLCRDIRAMQGTDSFPVFSTRRQFQRYIDYWSDRRWNKLAEAAIEELGEDASWVGQAYLRPE